MQQQKIEIVGLQCRKRAVDGLEDMVAGEIEVAAPDTALALDNDLFTLGRLQPQRIAEPTLAGMQFAAINVGVIEDVDADVPRLAIEPGNGVITEIGDPHQAENGG
ncbi:hypothetical protein D9M72_581560 [compost metagenome]